MDIITDPEEKMMCPYVPSHHIRKCRMNTHLVKCKKNFPDTKLVECDFNVNHKIPEPELQYHHENCVDRKKIEITVYQEEGSVVDKFPVHKIEVQTEESWDHYDIPSYNPRVYCENNEIIQHLDVESAAKRKNFRIAERQRISQLVSNKPSETPYVQPFMQNSNRTNTSTKMKLPEQPSVKLQEDTPDSVAALIERIKLGKNKSFVPKQK